MVDISSFFKKADFYGVLLPGYLSVTLWLLLFRPGTIFASDGALSTDLFSAVVFVIFGPAVGLGLQQLHRRLATFLSWATGGTQAGSSLWKAGIPPPSRGPWTPNYYSDYARLRLEAKDQERLELDLAEANYDFGISVGIALAGLGIYKLWVNGVAGASIFALFLIVAVILLVGGYLEWQYSVAPTIDYLRKKHPASVRTP